MNFKFKRPKWYISLSAIMLFWAFTLNYLHHHYFHFGDIERLKDSYVQTEIKEDVERHIVEKRPKNWVGLNLISKKAYHAIVVSEDWSFYQHKGYDLNQLEDALMASIEDGKKLRGASTITQQVIKNLFYSNDRSFIRKGKEFVYATYLEKQLTKDQILEIYLNVIEFGKDIYGIKAASKHYFNKRPSQLNAREGAFLAMLLPNPVRYAQSFRKKELTPFATKIINDVLYKMVVAKYLSKEEYEEMEYYKFSWEKFFQI